jgi:hypothetical protein
MLGMTVPRLTLPLRVLLGGLALLLLGSGCGGGQPASDPSDLPAPVTGPALPWPADRLVSYQAADSGLWLSRGSDPDGSSWTEQLELAGSGYPELCRADDFKVVDGRPALALTNYGFPDTPNELALLFTRGSDGTGTQPWSQPVTVAGRKFRAPGALIALADGTPAICYLRTGSDADAGLRFIRRF